MHKQGRSRGRSFVASCAAAGFVAAAVVASSVSPASAESGKGYPKDGDHPLRIAHYFVAPVGRLLELTITRPLHAVGSRIAPFEHIDHRGFTGCSRERPARSCTNVVR